MARTAAAAANSSHRRASSCLLPGPPECLRVQRLEQDLLVLLLPKDPLDEKNIMLEIRAGTGGDEASIWAGDLLRMYQKYCVTMGWKMAIINWNDGDSGGYKEATLEIKGDSVYSRLKYEAGAAPPPGTLPPAPLPCMLPEVPGV